MPPKSTRLNRLELTLPDAESRGAVVERPPLARACLQGCVEVALLRGKPRSLPGPPVQAQVVAKADSSLWLRHSPSQLLRPRSRLPDRVANREHASTDERSW